MTKHQLLAVLAALWFSSLAVVAQAPMAEATKKDLDKLQGNWVMIP
jgi:hypothetical protein